MHKHSPVTDAAATLIDVWRFTLSSEHPQQPTCLTLREERRLLRVFENRVNLYTAVWNERPSAFDKN